MQERKYLVCIEHEDIIVANNISRYLQSPFIALQVSTNFEFELVESIAFCLF